MKKEFKLKSSGKTFIFNTAPTCEVKALKNVLFNEIKKYPLGIKLINNTASIFDKQIDFTAVFDFIKDCLISIDTSEEAESVIFDCLKHCVYDKVYKVTPDLFDEVEDARQDYYEIILICIEENLRPFIKSLVSTFSTRLEKLGNNRLLNMMLKQ